MESEDKKEVIEVIEDNEEVIEEVIEDNGEVIEDNEEVKTKKKKKAKKKKKSEVFTGKIDSNWNNVIKVLRENKINYTTPGDNPSFFIVEDGKIIDAEDAKNLLVNEFGKLIEWI